MNTEKFTTVTYTLKNDVKIAQPINKEAFYNIKGNRRTEAEMHKLFQETAWDKGAISYSIDSETNEEFIVEKEIYFSKADKKLAKAQYADFKKQNPEGFKKQLKEFQKHMFNSLSNKRRLGMNVSNIILQ